MNTQTHILTGRNLLRGSRHWNSRQSQKAHREASSQSHSHIQCVIFLLNLCKMCPGGCIKEESSHHYLLLVTDDAGLLRFPKCAPPSASANI